MAETDAAVPGLEEIAAVAQAMKHRRRELINEPLDRIWDQLAEAAIATLAARRYVFGDGPTEALTGHEEPVTAAVAAERERSDKVAIYCDIPRASTEGPDFQLGVHEARGAIAAAIWAP